MRLGNVLHLYRVRIRARLGQECFAVVGIAAGVALLFASQVASESLQGSVAELSHGVVGAASLQLLARDPHGMPAALLTRVRAIQGVRAAAPLLEAPADASGPRASASVQLVGADSSLRRLGGALVRHTELEAFAGIGAILLPAPLAAHLGVSRFGQEVTLAVYGRTEHAPLYKQLTAKQIGGLAASPIVVAPLLYAQELTGLAGRVSRILVEPVPGEQAKVRAALARLGGRGAERAEHQLRRTTVRQGRVCEQLLDGAVRGDQRAGGVPVRVHRDVADRPTAPAADRGSAPRRLHARDRDRRSASRRGRARAARDRAGPGVRGICSRCTCSARTRVIWARRSRSAASGSSAGRASSSRSPAGSSPRSSRCSARCATSSRATRWRRSRPVKLPARAAPARAPCSPVRCASLPRRRS